MARFTIHEIEEIEEETRNEGTLNTMLDWGLDAHELNQLMNDRGLTACRVCGDYVEPGQLGYDPLTDSSTGVCINCTPPEETQNENIPSS